MVNNRQSKLKFIEKSMSEENATTPFGEKRVPPARSWSFQLPSDDEKDDNDAILGDRPLTEAERNLQNAKQIPLYRFVLTGGPCGGKTTGLARVFSFLKERGKIRL